MSGRARIDRVDENRYRVTLPESLPDGAYYERSVAEHYRSMAARAHQEVLDSDSGRQMRSEVDELLKELVYPFGGHFIGYGADPRLDYYFFHVALQRLEMCEGFDSFNYATEFGGIAFQKYFLALAFVVSLALKHEGFAEALVAKEPGDPAREPADGLREDDSICRQHPGRAESVRERIRRDDGNGSC